MAQTIPMLAVKSSQIAEIGHDPATGIMAVRFKSKTGPGSLYHYRNVTADDFEVFRTAESLGLHFASRFKARADKHPFERVLEDL